MTVAEVKNDLIFQILQINDQKMLEHLSQYFHNLLAGKDWWEDLSEPQKEMVFRGSEQIDRGEVVPDEAVRSKARQLLSKTRQTA